MKRCFNSRDAVYLLQTYIKKRIIRQFYKKVETTAIHSLQTIHALRIFSVTLERSFLQ